MSTINLLGIDHVKPEDIDAYKQNYGAHDVGKELKDVVEYYNKWVQGGTYEQVCRSSVDTANYIIVSVSATLCLEIK